MKSLESLALGAVLSSLGPLVGPVVPVDGKNRDYPGWTFDYAARRPDGTELAIEVVRAVETGWLETQAAWRDRAAQLEGSLDGRLSGQFTLWVDEKRAPRARSVASATLEQAVEIAAQLGPGYDIPAAAGVRVRQWPAYQPGLRIGAATPTAEFVEGRRGRQRLRTALARKERLMTLAGEAGFETHLVVVHWLIDSTTAWRTELAEQPPGGLHPQWVWAVDLNASRSLPGRHDAELVLAPDR